LVKEEPFVFQKAEGVGHPVDHPRPAGGNVRGKRRRRQRPRIERDKACGQIGDIGQEILNVSGSGEERGEVSRVLLSQ
jgi:hypothetical protein